ncbi:MAG: histidyl-tRNA synthetase [Pseudomonadota bacterium]|jgi:histidyl-tRNA synthetase
MSNNLQPIRGMKDLLPDDYNIHQHVIQKAESISGLYGYKAMATPITEYTSVFARTLGDTSEVVSKEMYSFKDRSEDSITLRPEFTAGIMRAFISNGLHHQVPLKFFSHGPLFRYDRPQAGRQRQFHQINFEYLGAEGPYTDAETLKMAQSLFQELGIWDDITLELNSLGCTKSRVRYVEALKEYFSRYSSDLSDESKIRLEKNPLRILDSKSESDRKIIPDSPVITSYYTDESKAYFDKVLEYLEIFNVKYKLSPRLVRGLDYYCHTAFEFTTDKLGAQTAVGGGGRYDGLSKVMGGPDLPAIGFAAGIERILLLGNYSPNFARPIVVIPMGNETISDAIKISENIRISGHIAILEHKGKIAKKMQNANKANASHVIFVGEEEVRTGKYKIKNMDDGSETFSDIWY